MFSGRPLVGAIPGFRFSVESQLVRVLVLDPSDEKWEIYLKVTYLIRLFRIKFDNEFIEKLCLLISMF